MYRVHYNLVTGFHESLNPFPNDKTLDPTIMKAFADDKLNVTKMITSVFDRVENTVE